MFAWVGLILLSVSLTPLIAEYDRKFQHHLMKKLFGLEKV
jgi:hypothetical protein